MYMHINDFESVVLILEYKIKKFIDYKLIENHNTQMSLTFTEIINTVYKYSNNVFPNSNPEIRTSYHR